MRNKRGEKQSTIFFTIHSYLIKKADPTGKIYRNQMPSILGRAFHIEKKFHRKVLEELRDFGIIIDSQKNWIKIKKI